jgi:hypothetical protein
VIQHYAFVYLHLVDDVFVWYEPSPSPPTATPVCAAFTAVVGGKVVQVGGTLLGETPSASRACATRAVTVSGGCAKGLTAIFLV